MTWPENGTKEALASLWGLRHMCCQAHWIHTCRAVLIPKTVLQSDPRLAISLSLVLVDLSLKHWLGQEGEKPFLWFPEQSSANKRRDQLIITKPRKSLAISGNGFFHLYSISSKYSETDRATGKKACWGHKEDVHFPAGCHFPTKVSAGNNQLSHKGHLEISLHLSRHF